MANQNTITFTVSEKQMKFLEDLAAKCTDGNKSKLIKTIIKNYTNENKSILKDVIKESLKETGTF